jgi:hypothetical protein
VHLGIWASGHLRIAPHLRLEDGAAAAALEASGGRAAAAMHSPSEVGVDLAAWAAWAWQGGAAAAVEATWQREAGRESLEQEEAVLLC